jgi:hypothetical protein
MKGLVIRNRFLNLCDLVTGFIVVCGCLHHSCGGLVRCSRPKKILQICMDICNYTFVAIVQQIQPSELTK